MQQAMTAMEYQKQLVFNEGVDFGRNQGEFAMALKIKEEFGIEKALEMSRFSRSELESGKLDNG